MSRSLFTGIVEEVTLQCAFFREKEDGYLQMGNATFRQCLEYFCTSIIQIFGPEFLRKPTLTDVERLYAFHENKHGLSGMLGSLDCTDWAWFGCPIAHKAQYCRRDHGPDPFILLEEKEYKPDDLIRSDEQRYRIIRYIKSSEAHQMLKADLIEHVNRNRYD
nr:putative harbinger transposase-derived protein [Tanacetum cinerariifolium]